MVSPGLLAFTAVVIGGSLAAIVAGESRARRYAALAIALAGLAGPLLADAPLARACLGFVSVFYLMRAIDLFRNPRPWPGWKRIWFVLNIPHLDRMRRAAPRLAIALIASGMAFLGLTVLCLRGAGYATTHFEGTAAFLLRWMFGLGAAYSLMETVDRATRAIWHALGWHCQPAMRAPIAARTLAEFWGRRWNLEVSAWLARNCFRPLAQTEQAGAGVAAAFFASALIHFYPTMIALGINWGLLMGALFILQGALVLVEHRLGVRHWPRPLAHAWVVILIAAPAAPLLIEPLLIGAGLPATRSLL